MDMDSKSKLNMKHGFMKSIIRNQVDRDNYDKEVRAKQQVEKNGSKKAAKARKPDLQTYVPPRLGRGRLSDGDETPNGNSHDELLKVEYEDEQGEIFELVLHQGDDPETLAEKFGASHSMSPPLVTAFKKLVLQEVSSISS